MERFLRKLLAGGVLPLYAACSCPPTKLIRGPESLQSQTIPVSLTKADCQQLCGQNAFECQRIAVIDAPVQSAEQVPRTKFAVLCHVHTSCPGGRRPEGLCDALVADGLGGHFVELARLEASAVHAFLQLALELELHGAPQALVAEARRAALDEVRHALIASALARGFGAEPIAPEIVATAPRSLEAVLADNASEGLVHERYGATLAADRARHASDPHVRDAMRAIAIDEHRHATHAAAIHAWGAPQVSRAGRGRIADANERAIAELGAALAVEPASSLVTVGGMPSATRANDLFSGVA